MLHRFLKKLHPSPFPSSKFVVCLVLNQAPDQAVCQQSLKVKHKIFLVFCSVVWFSLCLPCLMEAIKILLANLPKANPGKIFVSCKRRWYGNDNTDLILSLLFVLLCRLGRGCYCWFFAVNEINEQQHWQDFPQTMNCTPKRRDEINLPQRLYTLAFSLFDPHIINCWGFVLKNRNQNWEVTNSYVVAAGMKWTVLPYTIWDVWEGKGGRGNHEDWAWME